MKILVTNDDGIYAEGLWTLVRELKEIGEVVVVAPDREKSGIGTAVTIHRPLHVHRVTPLVEGVETFAIEGTPSDCVILALGSLVKDEIGLVVSGINLGANLADDVFVSGTVGAAFQAYFNGIPALAVSLVLSSSEPQFQTAAVLAKGLADKIISGVMPGDVFLCMNVPNKPLDKIKGIEITSVAQRRHTNLIEERSNGKWQKEHWIVRGQTEGPLVEGTDTWAILQDRVAITPLSDNITSPETLRLLQGLRPDLMKEFQIG